MIIGHLGPALLARGRWPRLPLAWTIAASIAPDVLRLILMQAGMVWWQANEYSHFLPWSGVLAIALAGLAHLLVRDRAAAPVIAALVASHIALDSLSGHKPLWLGGPTGLGLEDYQQLEFMLEAGLAWWGWRAVRRARSPAWLGSVAVLLVLVIAQAAYLRFTFEARPYATRCFEYPVRPCWIRRRERPPVEQTSTVPVLTVEIERR